ncbi:TRAP transporter large permease [Futiania mangrovi]|uniref:TRAP transporter large permease protein n=1 Tax=Futiania mangrovi TaxID=2959716 RepID=A0A9J6PD76_9PROT|nr:TRAP transporter large permease [Futiania mangrovii]MCP1336286.1 TRAP transporter large permease [Futiania mangrovii]
MLAAAGFLLLVVLLALGTPVGFSLAVVGTAGLWWIGNLDIVLGVLKTAPLSTVSSYELIAVPMFILMAEFVILSGVANSLFSAAATWVGRVPGGLAIATSLAGAGFGAISGSSTAAAATLSATSIPAMLERGYEPRLACGVVAVSGTLAMLIPPSVALVIYGIIADVDIGALLIGGIIPGIIVTFAIVATILTLIWRDPSRAQRSRAYTMREKLASLRIVGPMLVLLFSVTGVIYTGIATPTEASGIGALGAFAIALGAGRVRPALVLQAATRAGHATCMIMMIIMGAHIFGYFFTLTQTTQMLVAWVAALDVTPYLIMALIILGYLVLGCLMDQIAILILTVPILLPVIIDLGFDPVWFGVLVIITAEVGLITPPVGLNVFVVARYAKQPIGEIFAGVWPHVVAHILVIALLVALPQLVLWLPSTMR